MAFELSRGDGVSGRGQHESSLLGIGCAAALVASLGGELCPTLVAVENALCSDASCWAWAAGGDRLYQTTGGLSLRWLFL